jgi:glycosyltransferase involved in cell wall biosynthesis
MNIALYYPWVYLPSGAERTILGLTGESRHRWTIFTHHFEPENTFPGFRDRNVVELPRIGVERTLSGVGKACWRILGQRLPAHDFDALVVVSEGVGDLILFRNTNLPALCICLTPLRIACDPQYRERHLGRSGWWKSQLTRAGAAAFRAVDRRAWRHYQRVFCISEESRQRALAARLAPPHKLELLHVGLGCVPSRPSSRFEPFFLLPGRIMWTKNIELGISAFIQFKRAYPTCSRFRLTIAGMVDVKSHPYYDQLRQLAGGRDDVEFRIFPSDAELSRLYETCQAVLFTAFNEDWGIVPLEAMAYGKPTIACNRGGPLETVEHGVTGFLEEPIPAAFARRMGELATDPSLAGALGANGPARASRFSWESFARRVDDQIETMVRPTTQAHGAGRSDAAGIGASGDTTPPPSTSGERERMWASGR